MLRIANQFSSEMLSSGLYTNDEVNLWMEKVLYDEDFKALHRTIYQEYNFHIEKKQGEIIELRR
jgi:hypothetical protein